MQNSNSIGNNLLWKLLERFGVQGAQFILQIVLARILSPEHYGVLSLMIIFTTLANVFVQSGLNTALIQNKDVKEEDYSSVFWVSLGMAFILYIILFFATPLIARFYQMPEIVAPFRVLALMLIPGAFNSVQVAKISREMKFKLIFQSNIIAIVVSGIAGIAVALMGGGLWALVVQTMLNVFMVCIVMLFTVEWKPKFIFQLHRVKILFSYGWKLLVSSLLDTLYQDLRSLIVGKKYNEKTLGYYNRGKQFPQFIISSINGAVQSVLLPTMSSKQDDKAQVKKLMRNSIMLSSYIIFPMMAGLAGIASPLIGLLLKDKWLPCVPYLQLYCFSFAFWPVHTCNLQAINAMGRSDLFLKLELIKKGYGVVVLIAAVLLFDSPIAIAATGLISTLLSTFVNAYPNKKLIGYSYSEQLLDILPSMLASIAMCAIVLFVGTLGFNLIVTLIMQILSGVVSYLIISVIFKMKSYNLIVTLLKSVLMKRKSN